MSGKLSDSDCLYNSMIYLYHAMRSSSAKSRCTALDIIKYCEKLIKCADSLDDAMLIKISDSTIRRQAVTQEDIMRHARYEQFAHI